jgi:cytidyltransferase-like protein
MIIYADMVCDLFHSGHIKLIKEAKLLGNILYIGLHSDDAVESYKRKPIICLKDRVVMLESCKYVDKVIPNAPLIITENFLNEHKIDLVVHAHDEKDTSYNSFYKIPIELNKFHRLEYNKGISTTDIIKKCKKL